MTRRPTHVRVASRVNGPVAYSRAGSRPGQWHEGSHTREQAVSPVGIGILKEAVRKVEFLQAEFPSKTIQRGLVVHGQPPREISQSGCFYRIVKSGDLVGEFS